MFSIIVGIVGCLLFLICIMGFIGAGINCTIDCNLIDAIAEYKMKCIRDKEWASMYSVDYDDIYEFDILQDCCPWLWRYEKHLPAEKYEIIKPFLFKEEK